MRTTTRLVCEHCEARLQIDDGDMGEQMDAAGWKVARRADGGIELFCRSCAAGVLALATAIAAGAAR